MAKKGTSLAETVSKSPARFTAKQGQYLADLHLCRTVSCTVAAPLRRNQTLFFVDGKQCGP